MQVMRHAFHSGVHFYAYLPNERFMRFMRFNDVYEVYEVNKVFVGF
jgi:hypothetical protein